MKDQNPAKYLLYNGFRNDHIFQNPTTSQIVKYDDNYIKPNPVSMRVELVAKRKRIQYSV